MIYRFFKTQNKNRTSKDWITTILKDLDEIKMNVTFEEIEIIKKMKYLKMVKIKTDQSALEKLIIMKSNHSKVRHLKHFGVKMQKYFLPNGNKISQEEIRIIFKLRARMTNVKMNMKGNYLNYECDLCNKEESQEHILECTEIENMKKNSTKVLSYEKIFYGNVKEQFEVAKAFDENMKKRDKKKYEKYSN